MKDSLASKHYKVGMKANLLTIGKTFDILRDSTKSLIQWYINYDQRCIKHGCRTC